MRVALDRQRLEIGKSLIAAALIKVPRQCVAAQDLRDLDIKEMWGVKCFARRTQTCSLLTASRCVQEKFQDRRSIDDDHRASRSLRTASAGEIRGTIRERCARSRIMLCNVVAER